MIKTKKILFTLILAVTACLFTACPDPNGVTQTDDPPKQQTPAQLTPSLDYDKTVYKITMDAVINSSKDFVNQSIKSQASRAAELSEDDTWQGYIDYMWNVPSNIYGTSTAPGDNRLEMHGEDLGTLQPLVHSTDENGNYRKAVFEYKEHLYYVLDKGNEDPNNSYVVLSSEDDFNHIVFDQAGKIGSDDWFNFKIWVWEKDLNNELYRRGNLGYAYTLRNVEMLDGSFATITVAGFNYYHYGFRVWIKETDGQTAKPELPENTQDNQYKVESAYTPEKLQTTESDEDFIYEVVNNTSGDLTVNNYIRDWSIEYFDFGIIAQTEDVLIKKGESFQFKYKTSELAKYDNDKHSVVLGCYFTPEGKWRCGGWENNLNSKNKIHTVTVTDSEEYCMEGTNSFIPFNTDLTYTATAGTEGINITLNKIPADATNIQIYDISDNGYWNRIYQVSKNDNATFPAKIEFCDTCVEPGHTYNYVVQIWSETDNSSEEYDFEPVTATNGTGAVGFNTATTQSGVVITPNQALLALNMSDFGIRRDYADYNTYGVQSMHYRFNNNNNTNNNNAQNSSITDYFVSEGITYLYSLECSIQECLDENQTCWANYFPRCEDKTIEIPSNCGSGELSLTTFPTATWNSSIQKFVFTKAPVVSSNYPESTVLQEVGFIYHRQNDHWNHYVYYSLSSPQNEVSPKWWHEPGGTYYPSSPEMNGDRGYVICLRIGNTDYQFYNYQEHMFDNMPQSVNYAPQN